jgi:hypothetical protein
METVNYKKKEKFLKGSQTNHYTLSKIVLTDIGSGHVDCSYTSGAGKGLAVGCHE